MTTGKVPVVDPAGWVHKAEADHEPDPHYSGIGKWICFTCRNEIKVAPVPIDYTTPTWRAQWYALRLAAIHMLSHETDTQDLAVAIELMRAIRHEPAHLPRLFEDWADVLATVEDGSPAYPLNSAVGAGDGPGFEDRLTEIGDD